jgi:hypothetical protein
VHIVLILLAPIANSDSGSMNAIISLVTRAAIRFMSKGREREEEGTRNKEERTKGAGCVASHPRSNVL